MSGASRVRSMNVADSEARPVLGPAGNKAQKSPGSRKSVMRPTRKTVKSKEEVEIDDKNGHQPSPSLLTFDVPSILRRQESLYSNLSLSASCSSDASTDSFHSSASTGRIYRMNSTSIRRKQLASKSKRMVSDDISDSSIDGLQSKKRCAWVTPNTDPSYANFHDEEWGVPVHDDKKLFELLVLCGALAELTWPSILCKRHIFREVFADFDPIVVAKLNEKKTLAPGSAACSLLSELKLRGIIENARQMLKVMDEFGSFDKYIWSFVNHKPIVSGFRYPRQVPVKTAKADLISKDLIRRGFRGVGPTVVYSFMQVAGITNDHLISCFRFHGCVESAEGKEKDPSNDETEARQTNEATETEISRSIDDLSFSSE
ncbi:putative GMP synthase [Capsicum chacoense]